MVSSIGIVDDLISITAIVMVTDGVAVVHVMGIVVVIDQYVHLFLLWLLL